MELEVLGTAGIPEHYVLSVRAGATRRQVPLSTVSEKPFRFSDVPDDYGTFKVDVFELRGSARIPFKPTQEPCSLSLQPPVRGAEGAVADEAVASAGMEVVLKIRRLVEGSELQADQQVAHTEEVTERRKRDKEHLVREYLDDHDIPAFLQGCLQDLMRDRPEDPYDVLARQFSAAPRPARGARSLDGGSAVDPAVRVPADAVGPAQPAASSRPTSAAKQQQEGLTGEISSTMKDVLVLSAETCELDRAMANMSQLQGKGEGIAAERLLAAELQMPGPTLAAASLAAELSPDGKASVANLREVAAQLREDNARLHSLAAELRGELDALLREGEDIRRQVDTLPIASAQELPSRAVVALPPQVPAEAEAPVVPPESAASLTAWQAISEAQREVTNLAEENRRLVADLTRLRAAVDGARGDISDMSRLLEQVQLPCAGPPAVAVAAGAA